MQNFDYELIDSGDELRLERFGDYLIQRPCPQAIWALQFRDLEPDMVFTKAKGWQKEPLLPDTWQINLGRVKANLRLSPNGQVGIFPEQLDNWKWIDHQVSSSDRPLKILNTFSYTGMSSLFASTDKTEVCHVDGSSSAINWAKQNAESSHLQDNRIRWICDDVVKFVEREVRRGKKYDGIILDPPAFGRGGKREWKIEKDLPKLITLVDELLSDDAAFVVLTCHAPRHFSSKDMSIRLQSLKAFEGINAEELHLEIPSKNGHSLVSSFGARIKR